MKLKRVITSVLTLCMLFTSSVITQGNLLGDVNSDGVITASDASVVLQYVLNVDSINFTDAEKEAAFVAGKGELSASDAAQILQKTLNNDFVFSVESGSEVTTETPVETTTAALQEDTVVWNVSDFGVGTFSGKDGLTAVGSATKDPEVVEAVANTDGFSFTKTLKTRGAGSDYSSNVSFDANKAGVLVAYIKNGSTTVSNNEVAVSLDGTVLTTVATGDYMADTPVKLEVPVTSAGKVCIYGVSGALNVYYVSFTGGAVINTETTTQKVETTTKDDTIETTTKDNNTETTTQWIIDDNSVVATDYAGIKDGIAKMEAAGGGTVYIKGDVISCTGNFPLSKKNANVAIVGITNDDGSSPVLDFEASGKIGAGSGKTAFYVTGSYYQFKNFIVQHSLDCGMRITGTGAGHCLIDHMVFRYNANSGVSITKGGEYNTVQYTDSYRNCDIQKNGSDAEGFACKLMAGDGNTYFNCRSWDNADDGWDSYALQADLSYEQCATWYNGDPKIFTGEYDFEQGKPLDKNLLFVKQLLKDDPTFEEKYNEALQNGTKISFPQSTAVTTANGKVTISNMKSFWGGNDNGFKFASYATNQTGGQVTKSTRRTITNCLAFNCPGKGFDQNNGYCTFDMRNAVAFDCGSYNYQMERMTVSSCENAVSFDGSTKLPSGMTTVTPSEEVQKAIRTEVENEVNTLLEKLGNNIIPGEVNFDIYN